jgi:IS30 family transposase
VDELDVQIVVSTRRSAAGLTADERRIVALKLSALEVSAAEIAQVLNVAPRTIHRWRAEYRAVAAARPTRKAS